MAPGSCNPFWSAALAALDSDGDGFTNGEELGDPEGDGQSTPGALITFPGDSASNPIGNAMPDIAVTSPINNATLPADAFFDFQATASDNDGSVTRVDFFDGANKIGEATAAPYSIRVRLAPGTHGLTALAVDDRKGTRRSTAVSIRVSTPVAMRMASADREGEGRVRLAWEGGIGPFVLQSKPVLEAPAWENLPAVLERSQSVEAAMAGGFFRVTDLGQVDSIPLSVSLNGAAERPDPVTGDGGGSALMRIEGDRLVFDVRATGLTGEPQAAHIHGPAGVDEVAPPLFDLAPFAVGSLASTAAASGTLPLSPDQKLALLNGRTYVNFHTSANPLGEVRGQITPVVMQAVLLGTHERPSPVSTPGWGLASLRLIGNELAFNISYRNLSGAAGAAHFHGPAGRDETGDILVDLEPFKVGNAGTSGAFAGRVILTPGQLAAVVGGQTYVNIHTPAHPGGEIRGQVLPHVTTIPFSVVMSGEGERPIPIVTAGTGSGLLGLENDKLMVNVAYRDLSGAASMAHIHGSSRSTNTAVVMQDLAGLAGGPLGSQGTFCGVLTLTTAQMTALRGGLTYVNVHTAANEAGEIRGQIIPSILKATLSGTNEVGGLTIPTTASGRATLFVAHSQLHLHASYSGLTGAATMAHIHGPSSTTSTGNILLDLDPLKGSGFAISGALAGSVTADMRTLGWLVDGVTYLNIHTDGNPRGEVRGQLIR